MKEAYVTMDVNTYIVANGICVKAIKKRGAMSMRSPSKIWSKNGNISETFSAIDFIQF